MVNTNADRAAAILPQILGIVSREDQYQSRNLELTVPELRFLNVLFWKEECPMRSLSDELHVTPPSATITADSLVHRGLILRKEDKNDRRIVRVGLTKKGKSTVQKFVAARRKRWNEIMGSLEISDQKILMNSLQSLLSLLKKAEAT